jgi:hypothetical protein
VLAPGVGSESSIAFSSPTTNLYTSARDDWTGRAVVTWVMIGTFPNRSTAFQ